MWRFEYIGRASHYAQLGSQIPYSAPHIHKKHRILMRLSDDEFIMHLKGEAQTHPLRAHARIYSEYMCLIYAPSFDNL